MKDPYLEDSKKLVKRPIRIKKGLLSKDDKEYIVMNWKKETIQQISLKLKRAEAQIDKYIKDNLYQYEEENQKLLAQKHSLEKYKGVVQMTEIESSKPNTTNSKRNKSWIFKQP